MTRKNLYSSQRNWVPRYGWGLILLLVLLALPAFAQFNKITNGPPTDCYPRTLILDQVNNVVYSCGAGSAGSPPTPKALGADATNIFNSPQTITGLWTFAADVHFSPPGGPSMFLNRSVSTSTNTPSNGGSWILGPGDPVVNGCPGCNPALSILNLLSNNGGIPVMVMFKPSGSSGPDQVCDYLGCKLGFSVLTGAQQIGSGIGGNSDLVGALTITGSTTSAPYVWVNAPGTTGAYTVHPQVFLQPQFNLGSTNCWPVYTGVTSFTITCSASVTGTFSYSTLYQN